MSADEEKLEAEIATDDVDDGLIVIPGEPSHPPTTPEEKLIDAMVTHTADVFSHLSFTLNEHRKFLAPEWWSYFPIFCAAALRAYATIFDREVPESYRSAVRSMSEQLASRALDGIADHQATEQEDAEQRLD